MGWTAAVYSWDSPKVPGATPLSSDSPQNGSQDARTDHIEVLELMSDLLSGVGEGSPPDAFFSSL